MPDMRYLQCPTCEAEFLYDPDDLKDDGRCPNLCDENQETDQR